MIRNKYGKVLHFSVINHVTEEEHDRMVKEAFEQGNTVEYMNSSAFREFLRKEFS